jgi:phage terminase large subunit GpA-like protein
LAKVQAVPEINLAAPGFSAAELADSFDWHRKAFLASTPAIAGRSRIEREDLTSDQRRFFVPCSACGGIPRLRFEPQLREKGAPETARYHCDAHDHSMQDHRIAGDIWGW